MGSFYVDGFKNGVFRWGVWKSFKVKKLCVVNNEGWWWCRWCSRLIRDNLVGVFCVDLFCYGV